MKITYLLILVVFLVGCATPTSRKMNRLSVGMTKSEVLDAMGKPSSTASPGKGVEFLRYREFYSWRNYYITYFVRLVDGRVDSYGETGDFDSTKDPTLDLNIKNQ